MMHNALISVLYSTVILIVVGIIYFAYVVISAYVKVKLSDPVEMHFCQIHGTMLITDTINFSGQRYCAICFNNKLKDAYD